MSDRRDPDSDPIRAHESADTCRHSMGRSSEQARVDFAHARADEHSVRELYLLELAVNASDDDSARELELRADDAYRDALAITKEHDLDD